MEWKLLQLVKQIEKLSTRVRDVFQHSTTICNQIVSQNVTNGSDDVNAKQDYGTI